MEATNINKLLLDLKAGKMEVFDELYGLTDKLIYYTAFRVLKERTLSEDIMHDTFIVLVKNSQKYEDMKNPIGYITTIAKNLALNLVKKENRKESIDFQDEANSQKFSYDKSLDSPLIDLATKILSEEEFELVMLNVMCGYKQIEISKIKGESISTINYKIKKALKTLKEKWEIFYEC